VSDKRKIKRALVSVYDKTGLAQLAAGLNDAGVEIVSTGSTAKNIAELGIPVVEVKDVTGFAECLDGRVKTLHPKVHAGLLADLRKPDHVKQLADLGILPFELVVVNLYPFTQTVASGATPEECIEQIDIGGPAMVRGSAKNHANVAIVVNPDFYPDVIAAVAGEGFTLKQRTKLATEAFRHVAQYDVAVASWLGSTLDEEKESFPSWLGGVWKRSATLRYGENPHQEAALYETEGGLAGIAQAKQLHGKEMSYNNYVDADAARRAAYDHSEPAVAIIKHANPCGVAVGKTISVAYELAHLTDPVSAFGGVIAANREVTREMADAVSKVFTEVIVAPSFAKEAIEILSQKESIRILVAADVPANARPEIRPVSGGLLIQTQDRLQANGDVASNWKLVSGSAADQETLDDLVFAWHASRCVKSNGILLAKNGGAVGIGMGQVNRVDSCKLAVSRAGEERAKDSVAASDAFFPFADGLQVLIDAGVKAVVQPGGSVRDAEVIEAANKAGITMYFTDTRHFFH
jgi:phosphoribosylaminoimidazolecarboxamide formyltransferase/IMP cyclohydrolase